MDNREGVQPTLHDGLKGQKISDFKPEGLRWITTGVLGKLQQVEERLVESGYEGGLPLYLSEKGESLRELERELGISRKVLASVFDYYKIPRLNQREASAKVIRKVAETLRKDPIFVQQQRAFFIDRNKKMWADPEQRRQRIEKIKSAAQQPERKQATSDAAKRRWQDPEYKQRLSQKISETVTKQWQDPQIRQRMTEAIRAVKAVSTIDPDTRRKLSESLKKAWLDTELRERQRNISQRAWDDPEFRTLHTQRLREQLARMRNDPEIQAKIIQSRKKLWEDPGFRGRRLEQIREMTQSPEYRANHQAAMQRLYEDPQYKENRSKFFKELLQDEEFQQKKLAGLHQKWSDPEFRERQAAAARATITALNQDPEHLKKAAEGIRRLRALPDSAERFNLPTIKGYRKDIGYYALSAWEANVARILKYCGREFYPKESFLLDVPDEYKHLFYFDVTQYTVDFIAEDARGNIVAYELLAHPLENPVGYAKADMFAKQYPDIPLHIVDEDMYKRLKGVFEDKINASGELCGWETSNDNLYINPAKYS